ncbi:Uncharacterised protein [Burkholderia pseudomallei]|nr:Uncharacterised protein [Burkholderia pseudomallei]
MGMWKRSDQEDGLSEVPTEGESPSVVELEHNLVERLGTLPEGNRKATMEVLLNAIRTRSTVVRIRAFVAMGKEHWMGRHDHVRIQRSRWRYWSLPRDVGGPTTNRCRSGTCRRNRRIARRRRPGLTCCSGPTASRLRRSRWSWCSATSRSADPALVRLDPCQGTSPYRDTPNPNPARGLVAKPC